MINLLPEKYKLARKKDGQLKFITGFMSSLSIILLLSLAGLAFLNFYIGIEKVYYQAELQGNSKDSQRYQELIANISAINKKTGQINQFIDKKISKSSILDTIFTTLPSDIAIKSFSLTPEKEGYAVFISGYAPDDERLYAFKDAIEKTSGVSGVSFPLSSWTQEDEIDFSVNFKFNKK